MQAGTASDSATWATGVSSPAGPQLVMPLTLALLAASAAGCHRFAYRPAELSEAGAEVVLVMQSELGPQCEVLGEVQARNIHGDPKYMRHRLRNDTARLGGNVVRVDSWAARAYASGTALRCPEPLVDGLAAGPRATASEAPDGPAPADEAPPAPPAPP